MRFVFFCLNLCYKNVIEKNWSRCQCCNNTVAYRPFTDKQSVFCPLSIWPRLWSFLLKWGFNGTIIHWKCLRTEATFFLKDIHADCSQIIIFLFWCSFFIEQIYSARNYPSFISKSNTVKIFIRYCDFFVS